MHGLVRRFALQADHHCEDIPHGMLARPSARCAVPHQLTGLAKRIWPDELQFFERLDDEAVDSWEGDACWTTAAGSKSVYAHTTNSLVSTGPPETSCEPERCVPSYATKKASRLRRPGCPVESSSSAPACCARTPSRRARKNSPEPRDLCDSSSIFGALWSRRIHFFDRLWGPHTRCRVGLHGPCAYSTERFPVLQSPPVLPPATALGPLPG